MKTPEPLLIDVEKTAELLGIGKSLLYQMASDGRLGPKPIKLGNKRLYRLEELRRWVSEGCPCRKKWMSMSGTDES